MIKISLKTYSFLGLVKKAAKKHLKSLILLVFLAMLFFPEASKSEEVSKESVVGPVVKEKIFAYREGSDDSKIVKKEVRKTMVMTVTAYSSEVGQTDSTPFITAFGTHVRDGIVATNCLPKGTVVRFPDAYGDKEFVVEDRMNARYYYRMDIWMADTRDAIKFGVKTLKVEIL